jgi:outer membrane lipopolysaccharide assembly protein LptE/RlpB
MFKWNNSQKERTVNVIVEETKEQTNVDERLSKRILEVEDRLTELEFNLKEDLENASEFITKQLQERLAILEAQANRVDNLATSTSNRAASKDELLGLVNSLASALKSIQDRMDLPF